MEKLKQRPAHKYRILEDLIPIMGMSKYINRCVEAVALRQEDASIMLAKALPRVGGLLLYNLANAACTYIGTHMALESISSKL